MLTTEPGARDRYVTIEEMSASVGSTGRPVETWSELAKTWASKMDASGEERFVADQLSGKIVVRWGLPYRADMDPEIVDVPRTRRIVYKGRTYDITAAGMSEVNDGIVVTSIAKTKVG